MDFALSWNYVGPLPLSTDLRCIQVQQTWFLSLSKIVLLRNLSLDRNFTSAKEAFLKLWVAKGHNDIHSVGKNKVRQQQLSFDSRGLKFLQVSRVATRPLTTLACWQQVQSPWKSE